MPSQPLNRMALRYGQIACEIQDSWSPVINQMLDHRSIRSFADKPLPADTLKMLIAAAQSAATSSNLQVWSVISVESPERKARLSKLAGDQAHIRQAPLFLVWLADLSRVDRIAEREGVVLEALPYLESLLLGTIDAALAAQNAVIALESMGLGSVYIGAIRNDIKGVAAELQLPPHVYPVFGLCVGHPSTGNNAKIKPRLPQEAVLHREVYQGNPDASLVEEYDRTLGEFYQREGMAASGWSEQVIKRLLNVESLNGRQHLRLQLRELGFSLR